MSSPPQPVFLSYASQDADAAQRIAEAMRAAGIEAWFDQSELRGGDAWDQKIRRQIKECALFVPIVSANTDARAEGYFRLEWKLAVDRSHLMADDAPFLFPIAIDGTSEQAARVPDRFREVQWMRLGKDTPEKIAERAAKLLAGEARQARAVETRRSAFPAHYLWTVLGVGLAIFFVTKPYWGPKREPKSAATTATASSPQAADPASLAKRAVELTKKLNFTREDLAVAADFARKAAELEPTYAPAWGARARAEAAWIVRGWDVSDVRRKASEDFAKRALAIDPDEPNALLSHAEVLINRRVLPEAAVLLERASKAAPDDNYIRRALAFVRARQGRHEEADAIVREALRRDPRDPLTHMAIAASYVSTFGVRDRDPANIDRALEHLDRAIAERPVASALSWKAANLAAWKGDFDGALATLDRLASLPLEETGEDRIIYVQMWVPLLAGQPERTLAAAGRTSTTYFTDQAVAGPIGWMKGFAYRRSGRSNAASEEFRAAETLLRARLAAAPDSLTTQAELAITLALLGRKDEAARQFARYEASTREQGRPGTISLVRFYASMGDARQTTATLREVRKSMPTWFSDLALARDPWFDDVRKQPEFKALLAESAAKK